MGVGCALGRRRLITGSLGLLAWLLPGRAAHSVPSAAAAEEVVQRLVDQVWRLLVERGAAEVDQQNLLAVLEEGTDLSLLGRLVLGRYWREATPRQRTEYLRLFRRYMFQTFVQRLRQYVGTRTAIRASASRSSRAVRSANVTFSCSRAWRRRPASRCASTGASGSARASR
jgi:ABC-type transporter MlaC component